MAKLDYWTGRFTRLNPSEKAKKYLTELKDKKARTNDIKNGKFTTIKKDINGKPIMLTDKQIGYRVGYLAKQKESNKIFRRQHPDYVRVTK